ncbi:hypothetical protein [Clostridium tagluense]|uniref:hypothetical protein n=1 Tax=Clostridium tagluense TaxID=360422 RepID=UPI001C6E08EF|nr:hypothetical protein [Clostridium tagluense]MBW9158674.1 hypothetical protein [Clostridium tagluense]WLC68553.1 hypothetical protein KTC93_26110 [Clostridium tagluense]
MAGYIFSLDSEESLDFCIKNGVYSTHLSKPTASGLWRKHHEATFADYVTMKEGDNIYFFIKRKIYGIGTLVNICNDCKFNNYPEATIPVMPVYENVRDKLLLNIDEQSIDNRWLCVFVPNPHFFRKGIDMDDVLASKPESFKMLRAFWKLSFIKIDDEENKALKDIILKRNEEFINIEGDDYNIFQFEIELHDTIAAKLDLNNYDISSNHILASCADGDYLKHEMALEAGMLYEMANNTENVLNIFGHWDYISHQVVASPFKAIDYMDKMDIFGYKYITGFDTISKYMVIELKRNAACLEDIDQVIKYVEWLNYEYANGDYSMIEAFLVAYNFSDEIIRYKNQVCIRNYTIGRRPTILGTWTNLRLIKYRFDETTNNLVFEEIIDEIEED